MHRLLPFRRRRQPKDGSARDASSQTVLQYESPRGDATDEEPPKLKVDLLDRGGRTAGSPPERRREQEGRDGATTNARARMGHFLSVVRVGGPPVGSGQ